LKVEVRFVLAMATWCSSESAGSSVVQTTATLQAVRMPWVVKAGVASWALASSRVVSMRKLDWVV
jgi:hypothetical protein